MTGINEEIKTEKKYLEGSLGGSVVKNLPSNAGDTVQSLIQEDRTCCGATKPVCHNYWACVLEPRSHNYWAHVQQLLKPACPRAHALQQEKPLWWEACTLQLESSPPHHN